MSCTRSGKSLVYKIAFITTKMKFAYVMTESGPPDYGTPIILCEGTTSFQPGSDYVNIFAKCTSNQSGLLNTIFLRDDNDGNILKARFSGVNVGQGWTLYAAIRLRWV